MSISQEVYSKLKLLYTYYNQQLFEGQLPDCLLIFSREKAHGHFWADRWRFLDNPGETIQEISLNPDSLKRSPFEWHSTLVHEMCHLWRHLFVKSPMKYHDYAWGEKMVAVGLMPSHTGLPGGKQTGVYVSHYILPGGKFDLAFHKLQQEQAESLPFFTNFYNSYDDEQAEDLTWLVQKRPRPRTTKKSGKKIGYECGCGVKLWGKPGLQFSCDLCGSRFEPYG